MNIFPLVVFIAFILNQALAAPVATVASNDGLSDLRKQMLVRAVVDALKPKLQSMNKLSRGPTSDVPISVVLVDDNTDCRSVKQQMEEMRRVQGLQKRVVVCMRLSTARMMVLKDAMGEA